jgi:hypothetical protein
VAERPWVDTPIHEIEAEFDDYAMAYVPAITEDPYASFYELSRKAIDEIDLLRVEKGLSEGRFEAISSAYAALEEHARGLTLELETCRAHVRRLLSQRYNALE